jgi:FixJ family two-component response regulator
MSLPGSSEPEKLLISIVDDDIGVRESLGGLIRSLGFAAKEYASAEDFLTWGWWDEPVCLIVDLRLPAMGGLELQRYLAENQRARSIVFISGQATENEQIWAQLRGAVAFLSKPFTDESLVKAIRDSIARARSVDLDSGAQSQKICPLCHDSTRVAEVPKILTIDHIDVRACAVEMIKTLNGEWIEADGICRRCWKFYVGLGRVVDFLRSPDAPAAAADREGGANARTPLDG